MSQQFTILSVTNWTGSKASNNPDGGISSLRTWLENKSKRHIQDAQVQGDVMHIAINPKDLNNFTHIDGWRWAGKDIKITQGQLDAQPQNLQNPRNNSSAPSGPRNSQSGFPPRNGQPQRGGLASRVTGGPNNNFSQNQPQPQNQGKELFGQPPSGPRGGRFGQQPNGNVSNSNTNPFGKPQSNSYPNNNNKPASDDGVSNILIELIRGRYQPNNKFLDLGNLASDPAIQAANLHTQNAEKVFAAIFVLCEKRIFETREKRTEMVEAISFKGNGLKSLKEILPAASTFVQTKALDLSDNNFSQMRDITWWKKRFPRLEQIILSGNPVDSPQTREEVKTWYPNLQTYNLQPLNAPWTGANGAPNQMEINPPVPSSSPIPGAGPNGIIMTAQDHPEFPPGSTFGLPVEGKSEEQVIKEQMGLKFSYETHLKIALTEECLTANNWDYDKAMIHLNNLFSAGSIPADAFLSG